MHLELPAHATRLILIRHGEVEARYHKVFGGSRIDMVLSPLGHRQAAAAERWLVNHPVDALYASPMQRAQLTAAPLAARLRMDPVTLDGLREIDFGDWTGLGWDDLQTRFGVSAYDWLREIEEKGAPNGETSAEVLARVHPCLGRILAENPARSVAVVCHGGIVRAMLALLLRIPLSKTAHFGCDYGSITLAETHPGKGHGVEIDLLNFQPLREAPA